MSNIEFDTPANRIISEFAPKNKFGIQLLPDLAFLRQLSIQGRLRTFRGFTLQADPAINPPLIDETISNGETLFVYSLVMNSTSVDNTFTVDYGSERRLTVQTSSTGANSSFTSPFFDSYVGDGTKALIVDWTTSNAGAKQVIILGWVENTSRVRDVST